MMMKLVVGRRLVATAATAGRRLPSSLLVAAAPTTTTNTTFTITTTSKRYYRGEAKDSEPTQMTDDELALLKIAKPKSDMILSHHRAMPNVQQIPLSSFGHTNNNNNDNANNSANADEDLELEIRRKRLVYRSKQRGWLEVDLLLGTWASENLASLKNANQLDEYEAFVNMETIDIYNIITLRVLPEDVGLENSQVVESIQEWARNSPLGKADPEKYRQAKAKANLI